jgi:hypothetical protein
MGAWYRGGYHDAPPWYRCGMVWGHGIGEDTMMTRPDHDITHDDHDMYHDDPADHVEANKCAHATCVCVCVYIYIYIYIYIYASV